MKETIFPRLLALFLLLALVVGLLPMSALADVMLDSGGTEVFPQDLDTDSTEAEDSSATLTAETTKTNVQVVAQYEIIEPQLQITEVDPEEQELTEIIEMYSINGVHDLVAFDIAIVGSNSSTVQIAFKAPYLQVLGYDMTYLVVRSGDRMERIENYSLYADDSNTVTSFEFSHEAAEARIYLISSDQAKLTGDGLGDLYSAPTVRTNNMQQYHGVGDSKGQLSNHTWDTHHPTLTDFALCLNKNEPYVYNTYHGSGNWGAGDVTYKTGTPSSGSPTANHWSGLNEALREKLVLLLCYGMDTDSPSARYASFSDTLDPNGSKGTTYAAMQLVAWEWIHGATEGDYTEHYGRYAGEQLDVPGRAAELRNLVATNPDGIDTSQTKVKLIWSTMQKNDYGNHWTYGQTMIALVDSPVYKPKTGSLAAQKYVEGSDQKSGWVFELYQWASDVDNRTNCLGTAVTDANGVATFENLPAGNYYYIIEAPASEQTNDTTNWTLSSVDLGGTVVAGTTTWATNITGATITNVYNSKRPFTLTKSINASDSCIAQIKDNPLYSLAGAQYQVVVDGAVTETLATDANGYAKSSKEYEIGTTVTVKETVAPSGFKLNTTAYTFTIQDGGNTIAVKDEPLFDPPFALTKVDKDTTTAQGNGSFSGAVFKWEYFPNYSWAGNAERTWYLATDEYGVIRYDSRYCVAGYSSDQLYYGNSGAPQLPLGSVKITEIKNSLGYVVLSQDLKCTIVKDTADSAKYVWDTASLAILRDYANGNFGVPEPIDTSIFGSLTIEKIDAVSGGTPQGSATLEGAKFQVINNSANSVKIGNFSEAQPGEVCYEFTTDKNGRHSSGSIFPLGSYTVREVSPPTGYLLNESWSRTFTVTETARDFAFTAENGNACADNIILGGVRIVKKDILLRDSTGADAFMDGITFSVVSENDNPVVVNGVMYLKGQTVLTLAIQWDGSRWTAESGSVLPYGNYTVKENTTPGGTANNYYKWNSETVLVAIRAHGTTSEVCFTNALRPGKLNIRKVNTQGEPLAGVKFLLERSLDGESWTPICYSEAEHPAVGTCNSVGLADGCLTTGEDGTVSFTMLHPGLQYRVTEVETLPGYQLATDYVFAGALPNDTLEAGLELTNGQVYMLPQTGVFGMKTVLILFAMLLGSVAILLGAYKRKDG